VVPGEEADKRHRKICLLGDGSVGKTSLIKRYVLDKFDDKYITTIGTKVSKKVMDFESKKTGKKKVLTLLIWDIIGQRGLPQLHQMYFRGSKGAFIVCDLTRKETFDNLHSWRKDFIKTVGDVPIVLLINKFDLKDQAAISPKDIKGMAEKYNMSFFMVSAKSGHNVEKAFKSIGRKLI